MAWSDERVAELCRLQAKGWSASQIAVAIGGTRNSIIGKLHRLGRGRGRHPPLSEAERKARKAERDARRAKNNYTAGRRITRSRRAQSMARLPTPSPAPANAPPSRNLPLVELGPMDCRYPTNEAEQRDGHLFCGAIKDYTGPYCPYHAALTHNS